MKKIFLFLTLLSCLALTACAFDNPFVRVERVTQYVVIKPSATMLKDCDLGDGPPEPDTFSKLSASEKEKQLYEYATSEQLVITKCNARWPVLRKWYVDQSALYGESNTK